MSKRLITLILGIGLLLIFPLEINAHSGNTDENGGHVCRTNCEQHGLEYGEYHYHNGGDDDSLDALLEDLNKIEKYWGQSPAALKH